MVEQGAIMVKFIVKFITSGAEAWGGAPDSLFLAVEWFREGVKTPNMRT